MKITYVLCGKITCIAVLLNMQISLAMARDIFDKAESAKDCIQNNNCGKHKWLGKLVAAKNCTEAANCAEKINEYANTNREKIGAVVGRVNALSKCWNMSIADEAGLKDCYDKAKVYYRQRAAAKQEKAAREMYQNTEASSCFEVKKVAINLMTISMLEVCNGNATENMPPEKVTALRNTVEDAAQSVKMMWLNCSQRCSTYDAHSKTSQPIPGCPDQQAQKIARQALAEIPVEAVCQRHR